MRGGIIVRLCLGTVSKIKLFFFFSFSIVDVVNKLDELLRVWKNNPHHLLHCSYIKGKLTCNPLLVSSLGFCIILWVYETVIVLHHFRVCVTIRNRINTMKERLWKTQVWETRVTHTQKSGLLAGQITVSKN